MANGYGSVPPLRGRLAGKPAMMNFQDIGIFPSDRFAFTGAIHNRPFAGSKLRSSNRTSGPSRGASATGVNTRSMGLADCACTTRRSSAEAAATRLAHLQVSTIDHDASFPGAGQILCRCSIPIVPRSRRSNRFVDKRIHRRQTEDIAQRLRVRHEPVQPSAALFESPHRWASSAPRNNLFHGQISNEEKIAVVWPLV